jgi:hypothetical protein
MRIWMNIKHYVEFGIGIEMNLKMSSSKNHISLDIEKMLGDLISYSEWQILTENLESLMEYVRRRNDDTIYMFCSG